MKPLFPGLAFGFAAAVILMGLLPPASHAQARFDSSVRSSVLPELSPISKAGSASEPLEFFWSRIA